MQHEYRLSFKETLQILIPYLKEIFFEQLRSVWFIVLYLALFQILVLGMPLVYAGTICFGVLLVIIGLMFFMEGLRLGLMPLGESLGSVLPKRSSMSVILIFSFLLGIGATLAEPAISVLQAAGAGVESHSAPLLYSLLNDFSTQLISAVGIGVGLAVLLGVLRFFYGWSLKALIYPLVMLLLILTFFCHQNEILNPILGLAWDCGAVTTGPVTVPLVLALGIGVCRIVGEGDSSHAGFGIVTLASLFPVLAVLSLGLGHYYLQDYYGADNYSGKTALSTSAEQSSMDEQKRSHTQDITAAEFQRYEKTGQLPRHIIIRYEGGNAKLIDGQIRLQEPVVVIEKLAKEPLFIAENAWDNEARLANEFVDATLSALRAIVPLCLFLLATLYWAMAGKLKLRSDLFIGLAFAIGGMTLFILGINLGLSPLGQQLGSNVPGTFADIIPWGMDFTIEPLFESENVGKLIAVLFGFFLGYGATLAEPALNALGKTVENITVGAFKKEVLMQSVAVGVGLGIALGVMKMAFQWPLAYLLLPPYLGLLILSALSTEEFVNFAWDSAGVTTGPITVPLVLAMGLGIGANIPEVSDGFGILAMASVGPIITVLSVGLLISKARRQAELDLKMEQGRG